MARLKKLFTPNSGYDGIGVLGTHFQWKPPNSNEILLFPGYGKEKLPEKKWPRVLICVPSQTVFERRSHLDQPGSLASSADEEHCNPDFPFPLIIQRMESTLQMMIGWWLMVPLGAGQPEAPCTSLQIGILSLVASSAEREYCLASWKLTSRQLTT